MTRHIAIVGGGMGGLATALELTAYPGWKERYRVTLLEGSDRPGGKCATHRGEHERIEEHGIHMMQGWYHNTLRLLGDVFEERRDRLLDPESPLQTLDQALVPVQGSYLFDDLRAASPTALPWTVLGPLADDPCDVTGALWRLSLLSLWQLVTFRKSTQGRGGAEGRLAKAVEAAVRRVAAVDANTMAGLRAIRRSGTPLCALARRLHPTLPPGNPWKLPCLWVEAGQTALQGLFEDAWVPGAAGSDGHFRLSRLDGWDFREWLARHGATQGLLDSPIVGFHYNVSISNVLSASTAMRYLLLSASSKRNLLSGFRYGTGATMVVPIVQVLLDRGVDVRTHHRVTRLACEGGRLTALHVRHPAHRCTPADALIRERGIADFGRRTSPLAGGVDSEWRVGRDIDAVVLAVPPACLPVMTEELSAASDRWRRMLKHLPTAVSASTQVWIREPPPEQVFDGSPGMLPSPPPGVTACTSWMAQPWLLDVEDWAPNDRPASVWIGTTRLDDAPDGADADWVQKVTPEIRRDAFDVLAQLGGPGSEDGCVSTSVLVHVVPSDRYTLSEPGSAHARIRPDDAPFEGLFLAGDWTDNGLYLGCVEGAVTSGIEAARGIRASMSLSCRPYLPYYPEDR